MKKSGNKHKHRSKSDEKTKRRTGPKFKKSLGQNFLRDDEIAYKIAQSVPNNYQILEIGPGDGFFTKKLLETDHRVIGVEIDEQWIGKLQSRLKNHRDFKVIASDFLKLDWNLLNEEIDEIVITGNLPYHLTSPTLFGIFEMVREKTTPRIIQTIFMVQKEVGQRLTASGNCKEYGKLALMTKYHGIAEYLFTVPAKSFFPRPKVDGAVIRITFHQPEDIPDVDYLQFRRIVRGCFAQRRKMMRNSLGIIDNLPDGWADLDFDFTRRPEHFSFEEFVKLTKDLLALDGKKLE